MDPLTHTLVGANLASTRLGEKTRLATAALVIGANIPDVDAILYFTNQEDLALGFRRGWTHGVLALFVLPFILTGILLLYARLRPDPARRVDRRWLFALSTIGVLTHPFLDWLNNYGMRWLMPFDGTWSYGDSVFIMDPWLWLILGAGWLAGRRATKPRIAVWAVFTAAIGWVVAGRSMSYLAIVGAISLLLLLALLWRPRIGPPVAIRRFSTAATVLAAAFILARLGIHEATERAATRELAARGIGPLVEVMASPHPLDPLSWEIVAETDEVYRYGGYSWTRGGLQLAPESLPTPRPSREWEIARRDPSIRGFMTWVRFPWYEVERTAEATTVLIHDARYAKRRSGAGFGGVSVVIPAE
jgi:inner membrane protein